ncbi:MAG: DinB family protein [Phycisphaeraceae bacterium]|nr:DinB family protein [Phycisphaerales bacterium]MCB9860515.1 DinB family protein [Phycisphaeraceae bacterium]
MTLEATVRQSILSQFEAALAMFDECIRKCSAEHWDMLIAKYPFWQVAYHTLCFVECYLAPSNEVFTKRVEDRVAANTRGENVPDFQPAGMKELEDEYPSRRMTQEELLIYFAFCLEQARMVLGSESTEQLDAPSMFPWLAMNRVETHIHNIRHIQHHTGQLGVALRKVGVKVGWTKMGFEPPRSYGD